MKTLKDKLRTGQIAVLRNKEKYVIFLQTEFFIQKQTKDLMVSIDYRKVISLNDYNEDLENNQKDPEKDIMSIWHMNDALCLLNHNSHHLQKHALAWYKEEENKKESMSKEEAEKKFNIKIE